MSGYIDIENMSFSYGDGRNVLDRINLTIRKNDFIAVIGPSGCGKSTFLRLLAGLAQPDSGCLAVEGRPIAGPGLDRAVVFQDYSLYPWFNCRDNIVLALEQAGLGASRANRNMIAEEFLELVGLRADAEKLPGELSGGMRQRTAIARALAINAPILLMDEPFGALDEITRARQQDLLLDLWHGDSNAVIGGGTGKTVFFVTHDVEEAIILGNRVIVMGTHPGRIVRDLAVELPRPRSRKSAIHHPNFVTLRDNLLHDLNLVVDEQLNHCEVLEDGAGI